MKKLLFILFIGMTNGILYSQVPSYVPTNGLSGYWSFNGNANDNSGNNLNGTVTGASLAADRFGNLGKAYSFLNGNQFITLPAPLSNTFTNTMSYSLWYKEIPNTNYVNIFNTTNNKALVLNPNANGIRANDGNSFGLDANSSALSVNGWKHICVVYVGQVISIYLNGILINSGTTGFPAIIQYNSTQSIVGSTYLLGGQYPFSGLIDDIAIYNRALNQQEITNMFNGVYYSDTCNAVSGSLTNGLIAYRPFCGNANDDSGNGNNGTVNGATLTNDRFGNSNSSYEFNGTSNKINFGSSQSLINLSNYTYSVWINRSPNCASDAIIISNYGGNWAGNLLFGKQIGSGNAQIRLHKLNQTTGAETSLIDNQWINLIAVKDINSIKIYKNGVLMRIKG